MEASRVIKSNGLDTTLENFCDSSCAMVFLGGVKRWIYQPAPQIRMHQLAVLSSGGELIYIDQSNETYEMVGDYVAEMGANRASYIEMMSRSTDLEEIYWPDLCEARIATWIERYCSADLSTRSEAENNGSEEIIMRDDPSTDYTGADLTTDGIGNVGFSECKAICLQSEECSAVSYVKSKSWCWPKGEGSGRLTNPDLISAYTSK